MHILLKRILESVLRTEADQPEGAAEASKVDQEMTKRTLQDEFDLTNTGLAYVKAELEKLD